MLGFRNTQIDSRRRVALVALLVGLFLASGCGDSMDNSGAAGTGQAALSGSVTYSFTRAQTALTVPQDTVDLRFQFFDGLDGTGHQTQEAQLREFAQTITIAPVVTTTRSTIVTALTDEGVPLLEEMVNIAVTPGGNTTVSFAEATVIEDVPVNLTLRPDAARRPPGGTLQYSTIVTYSDGFVVSDPEGVQFSASGAATVNAATGLVTASDAEGRATIVATLGDLSDTATLTVENTSTVLTSLIFEPEVDSSIARHVGSAIVYAVTGRDQFGAPYSLQSEEVEWSSSHTEVASIDDNGVTAALAPGHTTITASVGDISVKTELTVVVPPASSGPKNTIILLNSTQLLRSVQVGP